MLKKRARGNWTFSEMEEECSIWIRNELKLSEKVCEKLSNSDLCGITRIEEFVILSDDDLLEVIKLCEMNFG